MMMKVAILTHTFPRFPSDTAAPFMGNLADSLSKLVNLYILTPFDKKLKIKKQKNYRVVPFKYFFLESAHVLGYSRTLQDDKKIKWNILILSPLYFLMGFIALLKLVKKEKIKIISAHWIIPNGFIAYLVWLFKKIPYTVTIPGSDIYLSSKNWLFKQMTKLAAENANLIISDNSRYLDQLSKLRIKPKKTLVINYGVKTDKFKILKKDNKLLDKYRIDKNDLIILAVGRLVQKKGFIYLIKSIPEISKKLKNLKLIIVGDGDQRDTFIEESKRLKIEDKVIFAGTIDYQSLPNYYNLADIFVMPSIMDDEGNIDASPVALMEAMLTGLMVVTTKGTIDQTIVSKNKYIKFTAERNPKELANQILFLSKEVIKSEDKGGIKKNIRNLSMEHFSSDNVAKRYKEVFEGMR